MSICVKILVLRALYLGCGSILFCPEEDQIISHRDPCSSLARESYLDPTIGTATDGDVVPYMMLEKDKLRL